MGLCDSPLERRAVAFYYIIREFKRLSLEL
jgi:hypothetical protein